MLQSGSNIDDAQRIPSFLSIANWCAITSSDVDDEIAPNLTYAEAPSVLGKCDSHFVKDMLDIK